MTPGKSTAKATTKSLQIPSTWWKIASPNQFLREEEPDVTLGFREVQKALEVCYCLLGCHPDLSLGLILGPSRSHPVGAKWSRPDSPCAFLPAFPILVPTVPSRGSGVDRPKQTSFNNVQTRCIVKGEAQTSPLFWRFSRERLFSRNSTRKPLNLIKSPTFTNTPCKSTLVFAMHLVCTLLILGCHSEKLPQLSAQ